MGPESGPGFGTSRRSTDEFHPLFWTRSVVHLKVLFIEVAVPVAPFVENELFGASEIIVQVLPVVP